MGAVFDDGGRTVPVRPPTRCRGTDCARRSRTRPRGSARRRRRAAGESRGRWWSFVLRRTRLLPAARARRCDTAVGGPPPRPRSPGWSRCPTAARARGAAPEPLPRARRERGCCRRLEAAEQAARGRGGCGRRRARHARPVKRALFAAARRGRPTRFGRAGSTDDDAGPLRGRAARRSAVRDAVWLAVDDGRLDGRELWRWLGRRLPGRYAAAPLFLFGWASWRAGNGALAGIAAERALASDPELHRRRPAAGRPVARDRPAPACRGCGSARREHGDGRRLRAATARGATGCGRSDAPLSTSSTAAAHARPSAMAQTTSDAPRRRVAAGVHAVGRGLPARRRRPSCRAPGRCSTPERVEQLRHVGADEAGGEQDEVGRQLGLRAERPAGTRAGRRPGRSRPPRRRRARTAPASSPTELDDLARPGLVHALVVGGRAAAAARRRRPDRVHQAGRAARGAGCGRARSPTARPGGWPCRGSRRPCRRRR